MKNRLIIPLALLAGNCLASDPLAVCAGESDDKLRLACYDAAVGRGVASDPLKGKAEVERPLLSAMNTFWELGQDDKRKTFVVRTFQPNFVLPLHITSSMNRSPESPTHPAATNQASYRPTEAKLQISLRAKVAEDLLLPGADLWVAYTQRSLWQLWNARDSSPFRSTDYQPEAIYVVPVPERFGTLPFGWNLRMLQLGMAHQSNGQSDPLSRSWNRVYLGAGLEHGSFGLNVQIAQRLNVQKPDDNPDLVDYIGRASLGMTWLQGASTFQLTWRTNLRAFDRGAQQLDWTTPVFAAQPSGLRWYVQLFNGYGETLLDYNHHQTSLGLGLALFQF